MVGGVDYGVEYNIGLQECDDNLVTANNGGSLDSQSALFFQVPSSAVCCFLLSRQGFGFVNFLQLLSWHRFLSCWEGGCRAKMRTCG